MSSGEIDGCKIPRHVSIVLDGNGRWAKSRGMPRTYGHTEGAKNVEQICMDAWDIGIKYLTVYAFSTENWNRPESEVATLMRLLLHYLRTIGKKAMKNNMRIRLIGDRSGLSAEIQKAADDIEALTRENDGLQLQIAINYGSRDEMVRAMRRMLTDFENGAFSKEELTGTRFASYLDTADIPDPDLMIRTGGEERLSNFLMWQHAYSEFYFTKVPWPDFDRKELIEAVKVYTGRDRRFGAVKDV